MGIDTALSVRISRKDSYTYYDLLMTLNRAGWSFSRNGLTQYLPSGDKGDYNWVVEEISPEKLSGIVAEKEKQSEIVGIKLFWKECDTGVIVLIFNRHELVFDTGNNRKYLDREDNGFRRVDVNWYLDHLVHPLSEHYIIEYFSFEYTR